MDTKSKKFNRSWITKTICFVLAIVFLLSGFSKVISFLNRLADSEENGIYESYYKNMFYQGSNFNLESSEMFKDELNKFLNLAYEKAICFSDGNNKKAYENYQSTLNKAKEDFISASINYVAEEVLEESGTHNYYHTFYYLTRGMLTLDKLATDENVDDGEGIFYFNSDCGDYHFELSDDAYDYDEGEDEYDYDEYENEISKPVAVTDEYGNAVTSVTSVIDTDETTSLSREADSSSNNELPDYVQEQATDSDGAIKIINANCDGKTYSGYYTFMMVPEAFDDYYGYQNDSNVLKSFSDYASFSERYEYVTNALSQYKNIFYAFCFENENEVITNHPSLQKNATSKLIKKTFQNYDWNYSIDHDKSDVTYSDYLKNLINEEGDTYSIEINRLHSYYGDTTKYFGNGLTIYIAFDSELSSEDDVFSNMYLTYKTQYEYTRNRIIFVLAMLVLFILCIVILVIKSGRRSNDNELHMLATDKIFTSLRILINGTVIVLCAIGIAGLFCDGIFDRDIPVHLAESGMLALAVVLCVFLIDLILYISRHIKNHSFFKNFFIGWLITKVFKKVKARIHKIKDSKKEKPAVYKDIFNDVLRKIVLFVLVPNGVIGLIALLSAASDDWGLTVVVGFPLVAYDIFVILYLLKYAYSLRKIFYAINQIRQGNYDVWVETEKMPKSAAAYAEDVNALRNGLKIAVDNAIKEEKTKTELITNVSHDLKTPLTSVINYVDLLSRCNIEDETAKSYIAVLGEKSEKLKRLIEDLVEASKASTGNMNVNLVKVSLNELTMQIAGEYEDEFSSKGLKLIIDGTDTNLTVLADSKMSYRVLDNLMNNIRKYAMPNTRVYLDLTSENGMGVITLRNISENQLNISASELMSRFVRGDSSRSTEGNGLGLSIAENFCKLQGGKLTLDISGDLFTARVEFKLG